MGVLFHLQQCRRSSVLRPATSSRGPPPPSPTSPRQPPRRNTPRLSQTPNPLQRAHRVGTPTTRPPARSLTFTLLGCLSTALLRQTGDWQFLRQDERPTKEDRSGLGIRRGNGTVVTVYSQGIRIPRHKRLRDRLINDYQLRDVMADRDRQINLVSTTKTGRPQPARLRYKPPVTEPLLNTHIEIDGYPEAGRVPLSLGKLPDRSDEGRSVPTRPSGILVKEDGRYMTTRCSATRATRSPDGYTAASTVTTSTSWRTNMTILSSRARHRQGRTHCPSSHGAGAA